MNRHKYVVTRGNFCYEVERFSNSKAKCLQSLGRMTHPSNINDLL